MGDEGFPIPGEGEAGAESEAEAQGGPWEEGAQWAHPGALLEPGVWADGGWGPDEDVDGEGVGVIPPPSQ
jgi:hypothetical protein